MIKKTSLIKSMISISSVSSIKAMKLVVSVVTNLKQY